MNFVLFEKKILLEKNPKDNLSPVVESSSPEASSP